MVNKMSEPIRVLLVEDVMEDAELNKREIQKELPGCVFHVVYTKESFLEALDRFQPHVIVSDYSMPQFDGLTALHHTLQKSKTTPFILCTGSLNEDTAVECMKNGATDYIIKEHNKRLGSSVINALKLRETKIQDIQRKKKEENYQMDQQSLFEASHDLLLANSIERVESILFSAVNKILPDSIVVLSRADIVRGVGYLIDVHGVKPFVSWLQNALSMDISDFKVPLGKEAIEDVVYNQGRIVPIKNGLCTFLGKAFPEKICQMIEKKLSISYIYHIGISSHNEYKGGITLLQKDTLEEDKARIIEVLVKQSSVTYEKLEAMESLKKQQNRMESLLRLVQIKTNTVQE
ncbi:MAG: response regulator, partial [Caldisericia bacterium]|nr:response regulator [Caldisericia bacterium]